ncbi:hypothetical protein [Pareuzebyella sediminis]|nr:hypothetical protein [Pareuzebyella sediminis]
MEKIFPPGASPKRNLKTKKLLEDYYAQHDQEASGKDFRKTIDRNLNYVEAIRIGSVKQIYSPKPGSLQGFIAYCNAKDLSERPISLDDLTGKSNSIGDYTLQEPPTEAVMERLFPKLPEKLEGIENRISRIEQFIANNDSFVEKLLNKQNDASNPTTAYTDQKLSLDFLNFLQQELLETKKQYQRAKFLYRNLGAVGLFLVPLKYALSDDASILGGMLEAYPDFDDDFWDDWI